jgi:hypothetical protein
MNSLDLHGSSFTDIIPKNYQSEIHLINILGYSSPTAEINATFDRVFFPMSSTVRSFPSLSDLYQFIIDHFGAEEIFQDKETGACIGARTSYVQHGISFFENEITGNRFRINDPILAFTAGITGSVEIAGEMLCLDPDGDCSSSYASYLEPEGELTGLPTHVDLCGPTQVCVRFHSFFNKVPFPPYARHGSNVEFVSFSAIPATQLSTWGNYQVPDSSGWLRFVLPYAYNYGQNKVETAVSSFGTWDSPQYKAEAVCGTGSITDPDVNGSRKTGNGPQNSNRCF